MTAITREELIFKIKAISQQVGFRAILPFADRHNQVYHSTCFTCGKGGLSQKQGATFCPFKVTFIKQLSEGLYRMSMAESDSFLFHNHPLPVEELMPPKEKDKSMI